MSCAAKNTTIKDKSKLTGPMRSGGTNLRTNLIAGSVTAYINSDIAKIIPRGRQAGANIRA